MDACAGGPGFDRLFSCNEPATTGTMTITADTMLAAPHKGRLVIDADDVRLDCDGHTVTGAGSGTGIDVFARQRVTITNCHPTSFFTGIAVVDSSGIAIRRSSANRNVEGIIVVDSVANLSANRANRNKWGFEVFGDSAGTRLTGNQADYNKKHGFVLGGTRGIWLESNQARWNAQSNIDLHQSHDNTLRFNTTRGRRIGFHLGESTGNLLKGNTAAGHGVGFNMHGVNNTLRGNIAKKNDVGFSDGTSGSGTKGTDNTYVNNTCIGNGTKSHPTGLC